MNLSVLPDNSPPSSQTPQEYLKELENRAERRKSWDIDRNKCTYSEVRVWFRSSEIEDPKSGKLIENDEPGELIKNPDPEKLTAQFEEHASKRSVCIIENIDMNWIKELGHALNIDPDFFLRYMKSPPEICDLREYIKEDNKSGWDKWEPKKGQKLLAREEVGVHHFHIPGRVPHVDESVSSCRYKRTPVKGSEAGSRICMSYFRRDNLCVFSQ
jgi:hypothetical protein